MRLVADTNIIFSILLKKNSHEFEIFRRDDVEIFIPKFLIIEIFKHKEKMVKLSKLDDNEILEVYYHVLKHCQIFDEEDIPKNIKNQAINLVADIDPKDAVFLASAITLNTTLWSGDKKLIEGLKAKGVKYIARTTELIETLGI